MKSSINGIIITSMQIVTSLALLIAICTIVHGAQTNVECYTSTSCKFTIVVNDEWSPKGAQRFLKLVKDSFFTNIGMFRVVKTFLTQFGIHNDRAMNQRWSTPIKDDPHVLGEFKRGHMSFAGSGPHSRTTQVFIAFKDGVGLGKAPWETPFGLIDEYSMQQCVDKIHDVGDLHPWNKHGVQQHFIHQQGNAYLLAHFPNLTYIVNCSVIANSPAPVPVPQSRTTIPEEEPSPTPPAPVHLLKNVFVLGGIGLCLLSLQLCVYKKFLSRQKREQSD